MRLATLDAVAGLSGDMLLGACIDAGVPVEILREALVALDVGASLEFLRVQRGGIYAVKANIMAGDDLADVASHRQAEPASAHVHANGSHEHADLHQHRHGDGLELAEEGGDVRWLATIRGIIEKADLSEAVKVRSLQAFQLLAESEAKIHHVPIEEIHFHEVGAVDAIADIVLAAVAAEYLRIDAWYCSPLNVGGGSVECAHGRLPVPAPATADLLRGVPTYSSGIQMELVTPTGAALVRALDCRFEPAPVMRVSAIGYGAGSRDPTAFANVLRLNIGETEEVASKTDIVWVLEAAVDDLNPQIVGYVTERALALGALDVMCMPVAMKKNRPGILITVLTDLEHRQILEDLLLQETTTLGLRIHEERRVCLERKHVEVSTPWGGVRIKIGSRAGVELNAVPEFEDCRRLAESSLVPLKVVLETALRSYRNISS